MFRAHSTLGRGREKGWSGQDYRRAPGWPSLGRGGVGWERSVDRWWKAPVPSADSSSPSLTFSSLTGPPSRQVWPERGWVCSKGSHAWAWPNQPCRVKAGSPGCQADSGLVGALWVLGGACPPTVRGQVC